MLLQDGLCHQPNDFQEKKKIRNVNITEASEKIDVAKLSTDLSRVGSELNGRHAFGFTKLNINK